MVVAASNAVTASAGMATTTKGTRQPNQGPVGDDQEGQRMIGVAVWLLVGGGGGGGSVKTLPLHVYTTNLTFHHQHLPTKPAIA